MSIFTDYTLGSAYKEIGSQQPEQPRPEEPPVLHQPQQLMIKRPPEGQKLMKPPEVSRAGKGKN